jgi:hypothetical protein
LRASPWGGDDLQVWRRREPSTEVLDEIRGVSLYLMGIDAKVEEILELLRDDDEEDRADS